MRRKIGNERERKTLFPIRNYLQVLAIIWNLLFFFFFRTLLRYPPRALSIVARLRYFSELSLAQRKLFPLKTFLRASFGPREERKKKAENRREKRSYRNKVLLVGLLHLLPFFRFPWYSVHLYPFIRGGPCQGKMARTIERQKTNGRLAFRYSC